MGEGNNTNFLFVVTPTHTLHIGWLKHRDGNVVVYSNDRYQGSIQDLRGRKYSEMDSDEAAEILLAAMHDLQISMPHR